MREQQKSKTTKKGNPPDHDEAVQNVIKFLKYNGKGDWSYWEERREIFNPDFNKKNKLRSDYDHNYDLAVLSMSEQQPFLFIEVDGEKHSKKGQQVNDGIAEKYVLEVLKKDIIRLDKTECNGTPTDRKTYLRKALRRYVR